MIFRLILSGTTIVFHWLNFKFVWFVRTTLGSYCRVVFDFVLMESRFLGIFSVGFSRGSIGIFCGDKHKHIAFSLLKDLWLLWRLYLYYIFDWIWPHKGFDEYEFNIIVCRLWFRGLFCIVKWEELKPFYVLLSIIPLILHLPFVSEVLQAERA